MVKCGLGCLVDRATEVNWNYHISTCLECICTMYMYVPASGLYLDPEVS